MMNQPIRMKTTFHFTPAARGFRATRDHISGDGQNVLRVDRNVTVTPYTTQHYTT